MAIPDFQSLMLPVLRRLGERRLAVAALTDTIAHDHGLSDEERKTLLPSGRNTVISNRVAWAVRYMYKAGLVARISRGTYETTPLGLALLRAPPDRITTNYLLKYPDFVQYFRAPASDPGKGQAAETLTIIPSIDAATPEERLEGADRDLKAELAATLLARLRVLPPDAFEQLIIDLLVRMGYGGSRREASERLGRSGDGGIDGIIREDALGLDAVYIQAKRYGEDNTVGAPAVQGFAGALLGNGATKGVFVTTSRFTQQAGDAASSLRSHRIVLIDGPELARLMIDREVGVRTIQTVRVQRIDLEQYEADEPG
ncbi:MAG: restriction endonuclease [Acetobacteraceae bacterium]